jgi:hypothetical protein
VDELQIDGEDVDHLASAEWPDRKHELRVFWFTVESTNVGGVLSIDDAARRLQYRPFLATEMGRGLRAAALPEAHNDDHLGPQPELMPVDAGSLRLYARVEVFETERDLRPVQAASTAPVDRLLDTDFPSIHRSVRLGEGIHSVVGELFLLPGFEAAAGDWDQIGSRALGLPFVELVTRRLMVSSRSFAATAATGSATMSDDALETIGSFSLQEGRMRPLRQPLRWGTELRPGDLLLDDGHFSVLVGDDGNGRLDEADTVIHCWRRPPAMMTLGAVFADTTAELQVLRNGG